MNSNSGLCKAVAMALGIALAGCTVGPQFKPPTPPTTTQYLAPNEAPSAIAGTKVTGEWWQLFHSPQIDQLVKQALENSPTLDAARARLTQAQEAIAAASSTLYPQVGVNAGISRQKVSATEFGLGPNAFRLPPNFNLFQVGPTVSYTIDAFGGTRRTIERQSALADLQRDQLNAAYLTLTGNTVAQALESALVAAQLKAVDEILGIDRDNLDLVRKENHAGEVPDSDVVTAETQLARDETLRPPLDQQLSVTHHALAVLIGRAPGDWSAPQIDLTRLDLPTQLPLSLPSELVHQRPDIEASEAQLRAASAQIGISTARLYPAITLSAGLTASSLTGGDLFNTAGLVWNIAAGLSEPVFDGGMRRAEQRAAVAAFRAAAADYQQTVLESFGQVADILEALNHDAQMLTDQQRALDLASEAVRLQRVSYSKGGTGLLNLLDAQRQYQQTRLDYIRAQAQRYQDTSQLMIAMGGGWWDAELTAKLPPCASILAHSEPTATSGCSSSAN
jgi:NodT family efflux transporter outer membrane factor (OMF) lipoprotein